MTQEQDMTDRNEADLAGAEIANHRVARRLDAGRALRDRLKASGDHSGAQAISDLLNSLRSSNALNSVLHRDLQSALSAPAGEDQCASLRDTHRGAGAAVVGLQDGDASDAEMGRVCRKYNIGTPERFAEVMAHYAALKASAPKDPAGEAGDPVAWREVREAIVLAISFLNRDVGTDRATKTIDQLLPRLVRADQALRSLECCGPKAWYIESRATPGECWELIEGREPTEYVGDDAFTIIPLFAHPPAPLPSAEEIALTELAKRRSWELSWGAEDEESDACWRVHAVNGGVNDREWTLIGEGATPTDAICAALTGGKGE